jgi:hypothetical protein
MNPPTVTPWVADPAWDEKNCPVQLAATGPDAELEPASAAATIKPPRTPKIADAS